MADVVASDSRVDAGLEALGSPRRTFDGKPALALAPSDERLLLRQSISPDGPCVRDHGFLLTSDHENSPGR
jgi:hypothetical protein